MSKPVKAWHFLRENGRMRWGPEGKVQAGRVYRVKPPLVMCEHGLHGSVKALDALGYAPGPIVCRVELRGEILRDNDKLCATERKVLWVADATRTLHEFVCWCAERALQRERKAGREPAKALWAAIAAKRMWLRGELDDKGLADASDAARAASAAASAASAAAWAASAAAWAARAAAWAASAALTAAWAAQNRKLTRMLNALAKAERGE